MNAAEFAAQLSQLIAANTPSPQPSGTSNGGATPTSPAPSSQQMGPPAPQPPLGIQPYTGEPTGAAAWFADILASQHGLTPQSVGAAPPQAAPLQRFPSQPNSAMTDTLPQGPKNAGLAISKPAEQPQLSSVKQTISGPTMINDQTGNQAIAFADRQSAEAMGIANQAGAELGALKANDLFIQQHRAAADKALVEMQNAMDELNYPGLSSSDITFYKQQVAAGSAPNATRDQQQLAQQAQLQLNMGKEMPKTEPQGWNGFVTGIAIALGSIGAAMARTPNYAQEFVNSQIQREVDRQEREWKHKAGAVDAAQNYYAMARNVFSDDLAARKAAEAIIMERADMALRAKGIQSELGMKAFAIKNEAAERRATLEMNWQLHAAKAGQIEFTEKERSTISESLSAIKALEHLKALYTKTNVPVTGLISGALGTMAESGRYNALRKFSATQLSRLGGERGVLTQKDIERAMAIMPIAGGLSTEGGQQAFDEVINTLKQKYDNYITGTALGRAQNPVARQQYVEQVFGSTSERTVADRLKMYAYE